MSLEESKQECMSMFGKKGKGQIMYYNLKNVILNVIHFLAIDKITFVNGGDEMAHWVKSLPSKPDNSRLMSRTSVKVEGEKVFHKVFSDLPCYDIC